MLSPAAYVRSMRKSVCDLMGAELSGHQGEGQEGIMATANQFPKGSQPLPSSCQPLRPGGLV